MTDGQNRASDETHENISPTKKPYIAPNFLVYGDIQGVTGNVGTKSASADGAGSKSKTF